jgi:hypothetical protein
LQQAKLSLAILFTAALDARSLTLHSWRVDGMENFSSSNGDLACIICNCSV